MAGTNRSYRIFHSLAVISSAALRLPAIALLLGMPISVRADIVCPTESYIDPLGNCCQVPGCDGICFSNEVKDCAGVCGGPGKIAADQSCCASGVLDAAQLCCPNGVLTAGGDCCATGVLDKHQACCASGVLDKHNECCASGVLDSKYECCGSGVLDNDQACCATGTLDSALTCCDDGETFDKCGRCFVPNDVDRADCIFQCEGTTDINWVKWTYQCIHGYWSEATLIAWMKGDFYISDAIEKASQGWSWYAWHGHDGDYFADGDGAGIDTYEQRTYTFNADGPSEFCSCMRHTGCFDPETPLKLKDGSLKPAKDVRAGDVLLNPVTGRGMTVLRVIESGEDKPLVEFGWGNRLIRVSDGHAVPTKERGLLKAGELTAADSVKGGDGEWHRLEVVRSLKVKYGQRVINFELKDAGDGEQEHLLDANGIVTGDLFLQGQLAQKK